MLWFSTPEGGSLASGDKVPPRLAASGTTLIALHEYRVDVITETGQRVAERPLAVNDASAPTTTAEIEQIAHELLE